MTAGKSEILEIANCKQPRTIIAVSFCNNVLDSTPGRQLAIHLSGKHGQLNTGKNHHWCDFDSIFSPLFTSVSCVVTEQPWVAIYKQPAAEVHSRQTFGVRSLVNTKG